MRVPGVNFDLLSDRFIRINPVTGNRQLVPEANDVMFAIERLGDIEKAATTLGVEEIEIQHWIDRHYVPTPYVEQIMKRLKGWDQLSLQVPPIGADWPE